MKIRSQLSRIGALLSFMVAGLVVSSQSFAEAKRYIVTFKSSERYRAASLDWRKSKRLAEMGLSLSDSSIEYRFLNTDARVERALDQVEMMIVRAQSEQVAEELRNHPAVANVEAEIFFPAPSPIHAAVSFMNVGRARLRPAEGCTAEKPWGISAVKAEAAWTVTKGSGSRVVVLDTGIDVDHPDLKSRFEKGRNFTRGSDTDVTDTIGHGTHVAGTIAADGSCIPGVAPQAKILMGKVCEDRGCSTAAIIAGIDWGVAERAEVISMSLSGPLATPSQQKAVERAEQAGVVVVASSGNDGVRRISYPAAYPTVIAVGAVGRQPDGSLKRAEFSQYGPGLDIVAPGVEVVSSVPQGAGRVTTVTLDMGDGKSSRVKSAGFAGAPQLTNPVSGQLVFAGLGKPEDIRKVNLRGKFALIQRGEISFKDKVVNAANAGATGVLIFNNAPGLARGSVGEEGSVRVPVAMIEKAVGEAIKERLQMGAAASATVVTEASDYDAYDGTSMATPHVAGVVALMLAANPNLTPAQVRSILAETAVDVGSADEHGAGLVNAEAAVKRAKQGMPLDRAAGL